MIFLLASQRTTPEKSDQKMSARATGWRLTKTPAVMPASKILAMEATDFWERLLISPISSSERFLSVSLDCR